MAITRSAGRSVRSRGRGKDERRGLGQRSGKTQGFSLVRIPHVWGRGGNIMYLPSLVFVLVTTASVTFVVRSADLVFFSRSGGKGFEGILERFVEGEWV